MARNVLVLPGDGIGPEILDATVGVLDNLIRSSNLDIELEQGLLGGAAYEAHGDPLPAETLARARASDAVLMGSIGGPQWDTIERSLRPERGLLRLRSELGLFANLRPAILFPELADASTLKPEVVAGLDILIVRELTGGIYFGEPRGIDTTADGERRGFNTLVYRESEIERICRVGFESARRRQGRLCSVDKANVLEVSELWREVATRVGTEYPDVELSHMYVDNA
nr:3-isopropylmalate dehydrogenase [Gammaproteobacteria bacterium]